MVKIEPVVEGKKDERLEYLLQQVKEGVSIFTDAIRKSSDEHESVGFKAFTLKSERKEEVDAVFDVIMSAVAIELKEQAEDLIKKYTFFHKQDEVEKGEFALVLFCTKVAPPTKEEIDKRMEEEIKANTVIKDDRTVTEVIKEAETEADVTLPHPSLISAYRRPGTGE